METLETVITCPSCGAQNQVAAKYCESCGAKLFAKAESPEKIFPYNSSRFLLERVVFIATSGVWPALVVILGMALTRRPIDDIGLGDLAAVVFGLPLGVATLYLMVYVLSKWLFSSPVGSLFANFRKGAPVPAWFDKRFSWQRFAMEFVYFFGIVGFAFIIAACHSLLAGH